MGIIISNTFNNGIDGVFSISKDNVIKSLNNYDTHTDIKIDDIEIGLYLQHIKFTKK
jgi:hypothetical protein